MDPDCPYPFDTSDATGDAPPLEAADAGSSVATGTPAPPDELGARRHRMWRAARRRQRREWIFLALAIALVVALTWGE
jgi:hypothetical protein